jgi:hypothetical protein
MLKGRYKAISEEPNPETECESPSKSFRVKSFLGRARMLGVDG